MKRRSAWPFLWVWCLLVLAASARADLRADIDAAVRAADLKGGTVAVSVRDVESDGPPLYSRDGLRPMIPASNMKLLTTGTALHVLGPGFEFRTRLLRDGDRLTVVADGDPGFGDPELLRLLTLGEREGITVEEFLDLWVDAAVDAGVRSVRELVVDDRVFDREFVPATWPADQLNLRYCAQVAGLSFHLNVLSFYPSPVPGQAPDLSRVEPRAPWLPIENRATSQTEGRNATNSIGIVRPPDANEFTVFGNVKRAYRESADVTIHNPPLFFARLLADRLTEAGVPVESWRVARPDEAAPAGEPVGPVVRTPLGTAITRCNRDSQNLYAEALMKRVGHAITNGRPGSWANGAAAVRLVVNERVNDPELSRALIAVDGSGMSRENKVAADLLTAWLNAFARDERVGDVFLNSLAVGGATGTLDDRFRSHALYGCMVHAKSGYLRGVSCLSGYVVAPDGRMRSFSVLCNDLNVGGTVGQAKRLQEKIVSAVAKDLATVTAGVRD